MNKSSNKFGNLLDFTAQFPCDQHPFSSHVVGICPHCLNDRLMILVCSDCGERRLSSCSCSDILIHRSSCSTTADFGRISFNDHTKRRSSLRRSSSSRAGLHKSTNGFGRIKRLFMKKRNKERFQNLEFCDDEEEENNTVFNQYGGGYYESRKRNSCQNQMDQSDRFCSRSVFPIKERESSAMDDETGFIELMLDYESKQEFCGRSSIASDHAAFDYRNENFEANLTSNGISGNGGSCRFAVDDRGFKQQGKRGSSRNYKIWKWIFNNGEK